MSRIALVLSFACALCAFGPAFSVGGLPAVNPGKTVSALELYGVPPAPPVVETRDTKHETRIAAIRAPEISNQELLIPNKPVGDLWSNSGEPPLRMPDKSEYMTLRSDFLLPEETLDDSDSWGFDSAASGTMPRYFAISSKTPNARGRPASSGSIERTRAAPAAARENNNAALPEAPAAKRQVVPPARVRPSPIKSQPRFVPAKRAPAARPEPDADNDDEFAYMGEVPLTKLSPSQLKKAFKRTFTSENKHLSTYQIDDGFDEVSSFDSATGFDSSRDLSEQGGVRPLEIKISFNGDDSSLSRDNYNLLAEYAGIVSSNPKRAVQISISERGTRSYDGRKLAARRLAIIEQVLRDSGVVDRRIVPVLSQRNDDSFVLRVISNDMFHTLTEKKRDIFGDTASRKTYTSMSW